jgi:hypothetical protein
MVRPAMIPAIQLEMEALQVGDHQWVGMGDVNEEVPIALRFLVVEPH